MANKKATIDVTLARARERNGTRERSDGGNTVLRNKDFHPEFRVKGMHYFADIEKARELGVITIETCTLTKKRAIDTIPLLTGLIPTYHGGVEKLAEDLRKTKLLHNKDYVGDLAEAISARTSSQSAATNRKARDAARMRAYFEVIQTYAGKEQGETSWFGMPCHFTQFFRVIQAMARKYTIDCITRTPKWPSSSSILL